MKKKLFLKQLDYELWANKILIKAISDSHVPEARTFEIFSHIIIAHSNWLKRVLGETTTLKPWDKMTLESGLELSIENFNGWKKYLSAKTDQQLGQHVYFPFTGKPSKISIEDLLIHLINHSSYHRGQIISMLKGKLDPLPLTTYIAFATENA